MILWCRICHQLFHDQDMETETQCVMCFFKNEGGENPADTKPKQQGDKALPVAGERVLKSSARMGVQLTLEI